MDLSWASNFLVHLPIDWFILVVCIVLLAYEVLRAGPNRVLALVLALPMATLIHGLLPDAAVIGNFSVLSSPTLNTAIFGIIFFCSYIAVRRLMPFDREGELLQGTVFGVAATIIITVIWLQVPELQLMWNFGAQVQAVFDESYRFWWIAGSYAALAVFRR